MRVAALGRTRWLYDSIRAVARSGHRVVLIGTCPAAPEYDVSEGDFSKLAQELGAVTFCDSAINRPEYRRLVQESEAEVAISVNWLTVIGQDLLDTFERGIINAHAGDLPRYRGNAVPNWAILAGEERVVLTLHRMTVDLDAGPILLQRAFPLTGSTYVSEVYGFLQENIPSMFVEVIDRLASGGLEEREQPSDPALSLRCYPRHPRDAEIDWNRSAEDLSRLVRASAEPFSGAYTFLGTDRLTVWRARAERLAYPYLGVPGQIAERRVQVGEVAVLTGDGVLVLEEIETGDGPRGPAARLLRSTRPRLGMDVPSEVARLAARLAQLEGRAVSPPPTGDSTPAP